MQVFFLWLFLDFCLFQNSHVMWAFQVILVILLLLNASVITPQGRRGEGWVIKVTTLQKLLFRLGGYIAFVNFFNDTSIKGCIL